MLEQQLDEAFERIVAKYSGQPSFQPFLAYFRDNYMQRISKSTATSSILDLLLLLSCILHLEEACHN